MIAPRILHSGILRCKPIPAHHSVYFSTRPVGRAPDRGEPTRATPRRQRLRRGNSQFMDTMVTEVAKISEGSMEWRKSAKHGHRWSKNLLGTILCGEGIFDQHDQQPQAPENPQDSVFGKV